MIINFEFWQNRSLDSAVLTLGRSFVTFDIDFEHFG